MTTEMEKLQGTWSIVSLEVQGMPVSAEAFRGSQIVMEGNRFVTVAMGASYGGTFTTEDTATPKTVDMLFTEGPHAGKVSQAIYKLDDDCLTLCLGFAGFDRPADFATTPGSGHALETLKRDPSGLSDAAKRILSGEAAEGETSAVSAEDAAGQPVIDGGGDLALLRGEWEMVSAMMDGQPLEPDFVAAAKRVVKGNQVTVSFGDQVFLQASFTVDTGTSPKSMDYTVLTGHNRGARQLGIYDLNGDSLRICIASNGSARPAEFFSSPGDQRTLSEWTRR